MSNARTTATATAIESSPPAAVYGSTAVVEGVERSDESVEGSDKAEEAAEGVDNTVEGANVEAPNEVEIEANADHCTTLLPQIITLNCKGVTKSTDSNKSRLF
eukprot:CAMPEP_0201144016 /NCGR_PEP_ID=MMETSP0851-20130426/5770_1 /ASSEMBLY_ACC=CAM_ASM_000631 /TAXON_ID=183588 /ORGANISM="Pseudo-nitzschia fraudulenta, Strain WWA7" /LENGTH=102 /DNA_ID=CAMNT_0047418555 /DNA_START=70 /DNA_END=378 /DNA_ORIENTATION=+